MTSIGGNGSGNLGEAGKIRIDYTAVIGSPPAAMLDVHPIATPQ